MKDKSMDIFKNKIRWKAYNNEFKEIQGYEIEAFTFKFKIIEKERQKKFTDYVNNKEPLMAIDIFDFLYKHKIKFSMRPRYIREIGVIKNIEILISYFLYKMKLKSCTNIGY